mgnify:CR=1 FL=1
MVSFPLYQEYFKNTIITNKWDYIWWVYDKDNTIKYCYEWRQPDKVIDLNNLYHWFLTYDWRVRYVKYVSASITAADINEAFSLKAEYLARGKKTTERIIYGAVIEKDTVFDTVVMSGLIYAPEYGYYDFSAANGKVRIFIDGKAVKGTTEMYMGLHFFKAEISDFEKSTAILWKKRDEAVFSDIPRQYFINSERIYGLIATYIHKGKSYYKMLETALDYRTYYWQLRPPYSVNQATEYEVQWSGFIDMKKVDEYEFLLEALDDSEIIIDGKTVYLKKGEQETIKPIQLIPGKKPIFIRAKCGYTSTIWEKATIRLMFKEKGAKLYQPVQYHSLYPY